MFPLSTPMITSFNASANYSILEFTHERIGVNINPLVRVMPQ
jgi:hypothetical protein